MSDSAPLHYLFRHCDKPTISPVKGIVKGTVPTWLTGSLTRNGPGIQKIGEQTYNYLFDGLAVIHRFHIQDGEVTYNNRPLESDTYRKNMAAERIVVSEFGTAAFPDPCDSLFNRFKNFFVSDDKKFTDNCSINVAYYGDQLYAMTEGQFVRQIDPTTLKIIGKKTDISEYVTLNLASAHPHILPDGTALNLGMNFKNKKGSCYLILQVPPSFGSTDTSFKNIKILAEIPSRWRFYPGYYHSFGITKDKIIFIEQPFCFRIPRLMILKLFPTEFINTLQWYPNEKTRIHVISMKNGEIHPVIYETEKLFTFHHCNAYEENGHLVVDVSGYDNANIVTNALVTDGLNKPSTVQPKASLRRYVLPLDVSNATKGENLVTLHDTNATATLRNDGENVVDLQPEMVQDQWLELPRINYQMNGLKYRYIYGVNATFSFNAKDSRGPFPDPDILVKIDFQGGPLLSWTEEGTYCSEPVFVANPTVENGAEDDGVILASLLYADDPHKISLLILDAKTMKELAKVDFKTEGAATVTFHGQWATTGDKVHFN